MGIVHTSDLMVITRQGIYILSSITWEVGELKTHSPTYCTMDNWENMLYLNHTRQNIFERQNISSMSSDKFAQWWRWDGVFYKLTNTIWKQILVFPECICNKWQNMMLQTRKNMITMGRIDTSDLIMIITYTIDTSCQSPVLKWTSWTHTIPYIVMKIKGFR